MVTYIKRPDAPIRGEIKLKAPHVRIVLHSQAGVPGGTLGNRGRYYPAPANLLNFDKPR